MKCKIIDYDDLGSGITRIDNKVCFVSKALPEEIVDIEIIRENKKYSHAKILSFYEKSKKRVEPVCKFYDNCGGCNFLHVTKEEENKFKKNKCKRYFQKLDEFILTDEYYYRNKVVLHVKNGQLGFYKEKTNELVPINYCYLLSKRINETLAIFNKYYDLNFQGQVIIRENYNKEILLAISGNYSYIKNILDEDIDNIVYNDKALKGNNYFWEQINNYRFKVHYQSFFQVNRKGLIAIYQILEKFLQDKKFNLVLDLYSGTSVLGIFLSKYSQKVISIEENQFACSDAKENIKENHINNLEIIEGKVENYIEKFTNIDLIVVDPTRFGLDKKTITILNKIKPKYISYIACGIDALKRDLNYLKNIYKLEKISVVDMFPRTNHVETVCLLSRKSVDK